MLHLFRRSFLIYSEDVGTNIYGSSDVLKRSSPHDISRVHRLFHRDDRVSRSEKDYCSREPRVEDMLHDQDFSGLHSQRDIAIGRVEAVE